MPTIEYIPKRFGATTLAIIEQANAIIAEYTADGYKLTLRQLYYQFVSRDLIANKQSEYKRLGSIINDARLAGMIDWLAIEDRTRNIVRQPAWDSEASIVRACADQFAMDKWADQDIRPQVWIEKEALAGVVERPCRELNISYFCCRGYVSQSEMWDAAQRLVITARNGQTPFILYFGDHDPSGIDMTRDIVDRIAMFAGEHTVRLKRMALNFDQIEQYSPPPNPAKQTDSRFDAYTVLHGDQSWELDALDPKTIGDLIRDEIESVRDAKKWNAICERELRGRAELSKVADKLEMMQ